jgi:hypothetical protein
MNPRPVRIIFDEIKDGCPEESINRSKKYFVIIQTDQETKFVIFIMSSSASFDDADGASSSSPTTDHLFRRLSLTESLRRTVFVYRKGWWTLTQIGILTVTTQALLWALLLLVLRPALGIDADADFRDPAYLSAHMGAFYALTLSNTILGVMTGACFHGAMILAVTDIYLRRQASAMECLSRGARHAFVIMGASFIGLLVVVVGYLLLIVPGLYVSVLLFVVTPSIVVEHLGVMGGLQRSRQLVSNSWCHVFCTFLIAFGFMMVVQMIWGVIVVPGGNDALFSLGGSIVAAVPGILFVPVFACMMTVLYLNLRVEKEALTAERLAQDLSESRGNTALHGTLLTEEADDEEAPPLV